MISRCLLASTVVILSLLVGCGSTHQLRSPKPSGFLDDYAQLKRGAKGEALMIYRNPRADFWKYDKILIEPVTVYAKAGSKFASLPPEDIQALVDYLSASMRAALADDYRIVTQPSAGTMRLRLALTEAKGSKAVRDTVSSIVPAGVAVSALKRIALGTHLGVGSTRIEGELLDAMTGERLLAAVDGRAGRKYTGKFDKWSKWQDAQDSYDYWAARLRERLAEERGSR